MRKPRQAAESGIYHVIARGAGRQIIFEDDGDKRRYLNDFERFAAKEKVQIIAWCLMDNHVHLLLEGALSAISALMRMLNSEFAQYFNRRYDRVGPLFQSRYKSEPVETDAYLLTVIRYIHKNPSKAGLAQTNEYRWSSYAEYTQKPVRCRTERVLGILGSRDEFIKLHKTEIASSFAVMEHESCRALGSDELVERACALIGEEPLRHLKEMPKDRRDWGIASLREGGLSVRQIERITGIGRGIISRAKRDKVT